MSEGYSDKYTHGTWGNVIPASSQAEEARELLLDDPRLVDRNPDNYVIRSDP